MADITEAAPAVARRTPLWIWALLVISVVLMGAGLVMPLVAGDAPAPSQTTGSPPPAAGDGLVRGFATGDGSDSGATGKTPAGATSPTEPSGNDWSPAVFRLGFSFFIGFAIASALKFAFKMAVIAIGFFVMALFGLQYAGLVDVKWGAIGHEYDSAASWLTTQFASFRAFITGYLPSAASAGAGMIAGFRRR
jgi:uncharacterized membrane protein (Fun14 family)